MRAPTSNQGSPVYVTLICLVAALGGLLFGYDTGVINGAIGFLTQRFELSPSMEGWTMSCAILGCAIGAVLAGVIGDRLGRKKLLLLSALLFAVSAVGTAVPKSLFTFIIFRTLAGVGIGMAALASPMYIAEITPARIRGRMVSLNQLAIVAGFLLVYFANYHIAQQGDQSWQVNTSWRWMFGVGLAPALLFFVLLLLVPESPRWLVERGRRAEAYHVLARIGGATAAHTELKSIQETVGAEVPSLRQLLRPGLRLVMIIGISLAILQQVTGINAFLYYGKEILEKLGTKSDTAFLQQIIVGVANLLFTLVAIWTVDRLGRRPLMLMGAAGMGICLFGMGLAAYLQRIEGWMLLFIIGYIGCFAMSVGPVTWVILAEIFPTRVRGRALAVATFFLWVADWVITQSAPFLNKNPWLVATFNQAFPFWLYAAMCVIEVIFIWRLVPETKGKSLEEIERSWDAPDRSRVGQQPRHR